MESKPSSRNGRSAATTSPAARRKTAAAARPTSSTSSCSCSASGACTRSCHDEGCSAPSLLVDVADVLCSDSFNIALHYPQAECATVGSSFPPRRGAETPSGPLRPLACTTGVAMCESRRSTVERDRPFPVRSRIPDSPRSVHGEPVDHQGAPRNWGLLGVVVQITPAYGGHSPGRTGPEARVVQAVAHIRR